MISSSLIVISQQPGALALQMEPGSLLPPFKTSIQRSIKGLVVFWVISNLMSLRNIAVNYKNALRFLDNRLKTLKIILLTRDQVNNCSNETQLLNLTLCKKMTLQTLAPKKFKTNFLHISFVCLSKHPHSTFNVV